MNDTSIELGPALRGSAVGTGLGRNEASAETFGNVWVVLSAVFLLVIVAFAVLGPILAPDYTPARDFQTGAQHPSLSWRFLLGSDVSGRPILQYVILGARNTFGVGLLAAGIAVSVGLLLSFLRGLGNSLFRAVLDFVTDLGLTLPFLPLLLILAVFSTGGNPLGVGFAYGLVGVPAAAVLLRPPASGAPKRGLDWIGPAPAALPSRIIRTATVLAVVFVSAVATTDFLGLGLAASDPSWGNALLGVSVYAGFGYWWWVIFPGLTLFLTLLALTSLGRAVVIAMEGRSA